MSQEASSCPGFQTGMNVSGFLTTTKTIADQLYYKVTINCLVLTKPQTHESVARQTLKTWAKRCNKLSCFSTKGARKFDRLGVIELPVGNKPNQLWP